MIHLVIAFAVAHAAAIGYGIGAYILFATWLSRKWQKPTGPWWKVALHFAVCDWASFLASKNADARGFVIHVGPVKIAVPLLSWSQLLEGAAKMALPGAA